MAYYLHGTTTANTQSILNRIPDKPQSAWVCSDQDSFFYLWKIDNENEDEDNLAEFMQGIASSEPVFLTCRAGPDAVMSGICTMASHPSQYSKEAQVNVLLIEIPDSLDEDIVTEDVSCDNMPNACCIRLQDLSLVNVVGYWTINVPVYSLPFFAASMLDNPYFSFKESDEYLCKLIHKLSNVPETLEDLWDHVYDWTQENPLTRLPSKANALV